VNFCQVEIFPIREDISSDRSRAPATRKRAAAAAGQEGGLPPPPLLLPPAPAPAPAPAPGIPYIIRESAASENRITSCSAVVSKRSVPLRHSVETLHSRFSHSSRIPRFYVISTSKSREIARPADSEKSASLKPPRHFLVFAPSLSLSLSRSLAPDARARLLTRWIYRSHLYVRPAPRHCATNRREKRVITARWIQMVPR